MLYVEYYKQLLHAYILERNARAEHNITGTNIIDMVSVNNKVC